MAKGFSEQNFELKVYLDYVIFKAKGKDKCKSVYNYVDEKNIDELTKFIDKFELTYINLKRLDTEDEELKPLIEEFTSIYEYVVNSVNQMSDNKTLVLKEEGNDNDEKSSN